jgi:hypothetical protein
MNRSITRDAALGILLAAALAFAGPAVLVAQGGPGYLFKQPTVSLKFETGYGFQRASGDIFDFVTTEHTLGRRDFDSPYLGGELAYRVSEQVDLTASVGYQSRSIGSEFREWVDADNLPITQTTDFTQVPFAVGARYYMSPRGRSVGRFAWIPRKFSPFVGGGVGLVGYSFRQRGDFVDFDTFEVFSDTFESDGTGFLARASAGVNVSLGSQFFVTLEGRYAWAKADMVGDFVGFDRIDLAGTQLVGGIAVRF